MATGSGIMGVPASNAIQTADISPSYSVPHDAAIADAVANLGTVAQGYVTDFEKQYAATKGAKQGAATADANSQNAIQEAAGSSVRVTPPSAPSPALMSMSEVGQARQEAFGQAYVTGTRTDIDGHIDQLARDNQFNPDAFKSAASDAVAGYVKGAPGNYAVQIQDYGNSKLNSAFQTLSDQKLQRDDATSVNGVHARQEYLSQQMLSMAAAGQDQTPEFQQAAAEWATNTQAMVNNPLFEYSPDQGMAASHNLDTNLRGAVLTKHALDSYNAALSPDGSGGMQGKAAALETLKSEALDEGGALAQAGLDPSERLKLYKTGLANIIDYDKADAERRAIAADQARQVVTQQREAYGDLQLGLAQGQISEADVMAAETKGTIASGEGARLINGVHAQQRQQAAQDRVASNQAHASNYAAMIDLDNNGELTSQVISDNAADLTPLQVSSLKVRVDKATRPAVADMVALGTKAMRDNGIVGENATLVTQALASDAHTFALNNPAATPGQKAGFVSSWLQKNKGLHTPSGMSTPGGGGRLTDAQVNAAYVAKFSAQRPGAGDIASNLAKYRAAHP